MPRNSFSLLLGLVVILVAAALMSPAGADNVTPTATVTVIPTTSTVVTTAVPTTSPTATPVTTTTITPTTVPATTATATPVPTATTVVPTTTAASVIPVSGFTASTVSGIAPLMVQFTDTSTNDPTSWSWSFGDGNTSTVENPSFTYSTAGTYTVTLTATNAAGTKVDTQTDLITVNAATVPPVADFSQSASSGTAPFTVQFTDTSDNTPTSWSWSFGDGNTSTAENPSFTYTTAGTYTVSLTAANAGGSNSTTVDDDIIIIAGTSIIPEASYTESATSGTAPFTVRFSDESANAPTSWSWDFGDGSTSTDESPSHTYTESGNFVVTLTASNTAGSNTSVQQDTIGVSAAPATEASLAPAATSSPQPTVPEISFEGSPTSGSPPLTVHFTATTPGSPESLAWDFGDGGTSTEREPIYTYTLPGTYTVTLTVKYPSGSIPSVKESYVTVGSSSATTSSPLSPEMPLIAFVIAAIAGAMISGRRRG